MSERETKLIDIAHVLAQRVNDAMSVINARKRTTEHLKDVNGILEHDLAHANKQIEELEGVINKREAESKNYRGLYLELSDKVIDMSCNRTGAFPRIQPTHKQLLNAIDNQDIDFDQLEKEIKELELALARKDQEIERLKVLERRLTNIHNILSAEGYDKIESTNDRIIALLGDRDMYAKGEQLEKVAASKERAKVRKLLSLTREDIMYMNQKNWVCVDDLRYKFDKWLSKQNKK